METSDSECFESADEELYSDDDNTKFQLNTARVTKGDTSNDSKLKNVDNKDDKVDNHDSLQKLESTNNNTSKSNAEDIDNTNVSPSIDDASNKPNKRLKSKLGKKLSSKVKKSDLNLPEKSETDDSNDTESSTQRPEFGIPPSKVECWFPNVPNVAPDSSSHKNSNSNPQSSAGNEQTNQKNDDVKEKEEVNMWDEEDDWEPTSNTQDTNKQPEPNMWEDDDWEPITSSSDDKTISAPQSSTNNPNLGWSSWGNWGVSSLLTTATTITNHVSHGITTVLESGMGVPDPEELAKLHISEKQKLQPEVPNQKETEVPTATTSNLTFGLGNFVSSVSQITKLVETTGNKVIAGGLDTLETIGKKTMEVLQEGDPGLKKKRAFLKIDSDKPVLSQILREAKEKAEQENKEREEKHFLKKANYETLFDDHQGLVHLEALEMLSKQCDIKLQTLLSSQSGSELIEMQETLTQVKELCELNEDEEEEILSIPELKEKLDTAISEMNISITYDKLISTWTENEEWLQNLNLNICNELELHEQAIDTLAQLTAIAVEQFHKAGELLLIKEHRSTVDETDSLVQLTMMLTALISHVATILANKLNEKASASTKKDNINSLITNIYFEAANSSSYIKDAFHLLIPVLQVGAV